MVHVFKFFIPTPTSSALHFGSLTVHFYALAILVGIIAALELTIFRAAGRPSREEIYDIAFYVIPAGIIGGRLYHVITSPHTYFNSHWIDAFKIWEGGMGIWGAVGLGVAVGWWRTKKIDIPFSQTLDLVAPGLLLAQSIGRWGNWFNGELFGSPSTLPWALRIPFSARPSGYEGFSTFHPVFLYESLWCLLGAYLLLTIKLGRHGSRFLLYIIWYCLGRTFFELLRIDAAPLVLGMRINFWVSLIGLTLGTLYFLKGRSSSR